MTGRERLLRGREIMANLGNKPFDVRTWVADHTRPHDCGTAACFGGWCARDSILQTDGLEISIAMPIYAGTFGSDALAEFFDLTFSAVCYIVHDSSYKVRPVTPADVIAHIDYVLEHGCAPEEN